MKRRWFLAGLTFPFVIAGCRKAGELESDLPTVARATDSDADVVRDDRTLVMATTPNYPPYQQIETSETSSRQTEADPADQEAPNIVGFDIDLANLIANRLGRELAVIDLPFDALIPALTGDEVDMVMAALEPSRSRKQLVDFSDIYYRSQHALVSIEGYLQSRDLGYQVIGVHSRSVQARFAQKLNDEELPGLVIESYDSLSQLFDAIDTGEVAGAIVEANVVDGYIQRYADLEASVMPTEGPSGSAIALPKDSPLLRDINTALSEIKASGKMDQLIDRWFG
jgi:polar amino acid transport system substrate-binding protein